MSESLYLLSICLPLGAIVLVFGMRYFAATQQARARLANDEAYRQLAAEAAATQAQTASALSSIGATLTDLQARLAAVEKILKQVE
ncbi:MAG: hypothetical protein IV094_15765 [Vitreoscilla sp.]|nr:hypothetical protein [Vitreoscilla sp.]